MARGRTGSTILPVASLPRAITGLVLGAAVGGALVSLVQFAAVHLGLGGGRYGGTSDGLMFTALAATVIYVAGLTFVAPIWFVLHRCGHRQAWKAALCGASLSVAAPIAFAISLNLSLRRFPPVPDARTLVLFLLPMAVIGGLVGLVVWRTAYRLQARG